MAYRDYISPLAILSIRTPRKGAVALLGAGVGKSTVWLSLAIIVILKALFDRLHHMVMPEVLNQAGLPIKLLPPFLAVLFTFLFIVSFDFVVTRIGKSFGATGRFIDVLLADSWVRFIGLGAIVLDIFAYMVSRQLGQIVLLGSYFYLIWILVNFMSVALGGMSLGKTFVTLLLSFIITSTPFLFLLSVFGANFQI